MNAQDEAPDPILDEETDNRTTSSFAHTVQRVSRLRSASRLIFWSLLIPPFATIAIAFVFVLIWKPVSFPEFLSLISDAGELLVWIGLIWVFSALREDDERTRLLASILIVATGAAFFGNLLDSIGTLTQPDYPGAGWAVSSMRFAGVAGVVLGCQLYKRLSLGFRSDRLAERFGLVGWLYLAAYVWLWAGNWAIQGQTSQSIVRALTIGRSLPSTAVFIFGLVILFRFYRMTGWILNGRCAKCAYPLRGLPSSRCPECGTIILLPTADALSPTGRETPA